MVQAGGAARLAAEALDELLVVGVAVEQHLEGDLPPEQPVVGQVDVGHAAAAQLAD